MEKKPTGPQTHFPATKRPPQAVELNYRWSIFLSASVVVLLPWIAYLAISLPKRYDARHWDLLWVGFDVALIAVLIVAAYAAWFRRRVLISVSIVAGTLLFCDAWFDVVTSWGNEDGWLSVATAVGIEIPTGIMFFWMARRIMFRLLTIHELNGLTGP